ncbi:hypothetical protein [Streptomyces sp. NPDC091268]|uniref:hypothetical protein n=1 Tax=Streptomyces sp. NPDC091268 TaxID=3365979 RepID=UPI003808B8DD
MSETTPQPEVTDLGAIQGIGGLAEGTTTGAIPLTEIKPEDIGTLSLRYVDGVATLVVSGGTAVPSHLAMVDAEGNAIAVYENIPVPTNIAAVHPAVKSQAFDRSYDIFEANVGLADFDEVTE